MRVSSVQMDIKLNDPDYNFAHAVQLVRQAAASGADVVVLPETWNTGFFPTEKLKELSDCDGAHVKSTFGALAQELNVNIVCGSVSNVRTDSRVYNTAMVFDRKGNCIAEYDKTHAFTPMGEDKSYAQGRRISVFELDGHKCGIIICYDVRFCELVRTISLQGIDVLFIPAQWPGKRRLHWQTLTRARAIENQIFVITCNSCGAAGKTVYGGSSAIFDPWGEELAVAGEHEEIISAELDFSVIEKIRSSINVYRDRRPELYNIR